MTEWIKVQGSPEKQEEFDTTSSEVYVYQRKNFHKITITSESGINTELWEYDERKLTKDEYPLVQNISNQEKAISMLENAICELDLRA